MKTVKLISFHPDVEAQASLLRRPGVTIDFAPLVRTSAVIGEMANLNPRVLVLDLDKLPSHAREIALTLRGSKSARNIPILFAGSLPHNDGLPEKFARLRSELPDIPYTCWPDACGALGRMLEEPATASPIVPPPRVYSATLAQKLGIISRSAAPAKRLKHIALVAPPEDFVSMLGDLPETVLFSTRMTGKTDLSICFVRSLDDLRATIDMLTLGLPLAASVWIAYPKRTPHKHRDFNENDVRNLCLAANFVDYKICSMDTSWSAIKFAHRRKSESDATSNAGTRHNH